MMKPTSYYKRLQGELARSLARPTAAVPGERTKLRMELEKRFMAAWKLAPDRMKLGARLEARLHRRAGGKLLSLSHVSRYTGADDQRVIVSQPYGFDAVELASALDIGAELTPTVIEADEWAFYYPGRARLIVIAFPLGYAKALARLGA